MSLSNKLRVLLDGAISPAGGIFSSAPQYSWKFEDSLADGVALDQADRIYIATEQAIATGADLTLDLAGGGLTDPFGVALTFVKVKAILVWNRTTTAAYTITVGGGANPLAALTNAITVGPGGVLALYRPDLAAMAVTAGTGDIVKIHNPAAGGVSVDVIIVGTSA